MRRGRERLVEKEATFMQLQVMKMRLISVLIEKGEVIGTRTLLLIRMSTNLL